MLKHTEIKKGKMIILENTPYEVIKHSHSVRGRGRSVVQTQLKNMKTGSILQKTFHAGDTVNEAELEKINVVFIYSHRGKYFFHEEKNPANRFELDQDQIGEKSDYLKEKALLVAVLFKEKIIGLQLPVKMIFLVKEAPPGVKGDRSEGGTKTVTLETEKTVDVPLFIEEGDLVEINTETGEYVRRIS